MALVTCALRSGSSGNCIYVGNENEGVLVDVGISAKCALDSLKEVGISPDNVKAILVTHEHSDHISGVRVLSKKLDVPVIASEGTLAYMEANNKLAENCQIISVTGENSFYFNSFEIFPFNISHDAAEPVGYRIYVDGQSCSVVTDLGFFPKKIQGIVAGSELMYIESNHDIEMLNKNLRYPEFLKKRILSRKGHLDNGTCADNITTLCSMGTKHFVLSHLSQNNNTHDLAYDKTYKTLLAANAEPNFDFSLSVANYNSISNIYRIK